MRRSLAVLLVLACAACSLDLDRLRHGTADASADAGRDASSDDAAANDTSVPDAFVPDVGAMDAATVDAFSSDGGIDAFARVDGGSDGGRDGGADAAAPETNCGNGLDDDHDGVADCADSDCDGRMPRAGAICHLLAAHEIDCGDNVDNDLDTHRDCADPDCEGVAPTPASLCLTGALHETNCRNGIDDDSDSMVDCADVADCATGAVCTRSGGMAGTCSAAHTCT